MTRKGLARWNHTSESRNAGAWRVGAVGRFSDATVGTFGRACRISSTKSLTTLVRLFPGGTDQPKGDVRGPGGVPSEGRGWK